jgi:hypothetical protein
VGMGLRYCGGLWAGIQDMVRLGVLQGIRNIARLRILGEKRCMVSLCLGGLGLIIEPNWRLEGREGRETMIAILAYTNTHRRINSRRAIPDIALLSLLEQIRDIVHLIHLEGIGGLIIREAIDTNRREVP